MLPLSSAYVLSQSQNIAYFLYGQPSPQLQTELAYYTMVHIEM
jgi:hypothetical protein